MVRSRGFHIGSVGALARSRGLRIAPVGALALALACGSEPPGGGSAAPTAAEGRDTLAERVARDLAAIEALHRRDREASLAGDWPTLMGLWSDDPVALPPDGPVQEGREAVERSLERYREAAEAWETVEYVQDFGEVQVMGDYAWDWGTF
ncbi:MAG: nuclear transport factor 2 family protein, partial [Gemmatimonadota bacterium]